jgi:REP element-mobilizing transposase RayT
LTTTDDRYRYVRKNIRLDASAYAQLESICSVTIAVEARRPIFSHPRNAALAVEVLHQLTERYRVRMFGYCVMPDHVHLVLSPSPTCDIVTFVGRFKNLSQRALWQRGVVGSFWQKSFWDHFVRQDEGLERTVMYGADNPVRRGLIGDWRDYPFAGSFVLQL